MSSARVTNPCYLSKSTSSKAQTVAIYSMSEFPRRGRALWLLWKWNNYNRTSRSNLNIKLYTTWSLLIRFVTTYNITTTEVKREHNEIDLIQISIDDKEEYISIFFTGTSHTSQIQGSNSSAVISSTTNLQFETFFSASPDCVETESSLSSGSLESKTLQAPHHCSNGRNDSFHLHSSKSRCTVICSCCGIAFWTSCFTGLCLTGKMDPL